MGVMCNNHEISSVGQLFKTVNAKENAVDKFPRNAICGIKKIKSRRESLVVMFSLGSTKVFFSDPSIETDTAKTLIKRLRGRLLSRGLKTKYPWTKGVCYAAAVYQKAYRLGISYPKRTRKVQLGICTVAKFHRMSLPEQDFWGLKLKMPRLNYCLRYVSMMLTM